MRIGIDATQYERLVHALKHPTIARMNAEGRMQGDPAARLDPRSAFPRAPSKAGFEPIETVFASRYSLFHNVDRPLLPPPVELPTAEIQSLKQAGQLERISVLIPTRELWMALMFNQARYPCNLGIFFDAISIGYGNSYLQ